MSKSGVGKSTSFKSDSKVRAVHTSKKASKGHTNPPTCLPCLFSLEPRALAYRQRAKQLVHWFGTWRTWQRRAAICHAMEHCSVKQLELLATALEPTLHLDFSSSFVPHLASLHLDGAATFRVRRGVMQDVLNLSALEERAGKVLEESQRGGNDLNPTSSGLTTLFTSTSDESRGSTTAELPRTSLTPTRNNSGTEEGAKLLGTVVSARGNMLPILPLTHTNHAALGQCASRYVSIEKAVSLHRKRFASVPDFKSTTSLLKHIKHKESLRPLGRAKHQRSASEGGLIRASLYGGRQQVKRPAECFKEQLSTLSKARDMQGPYSHTYMYLMHDYYKKILTISSVWLLSAVDE